MPERESSNAEKLNEALMEKTNEMLEQLQMAQRIQLGLIPDARNFPQCPELGFASHYTAMDGIGGDIYDVIRISEKMYAFMIADVSGHGVPAALITAMVKMSFNTNSRMGIEPAEVCDKVCREMFRYIGDMDYYLTAYYCMLDLATGEFSYTNAGHHPAMCYRKETNTVELLDSMGFFIGVVDDGQYTTGRTILNPGDKIILLTDGIPEARSHEGTFFGYDRLMLFVNSYAGKSPAEFVEKLVRCVDEFCEGRRADDDRALLCVEYRRKTRI